MFNVLKQKIDSHKIISFDIFDTLIIRPYEKPTDVFLHIELAYKVKNFCNIRQEAESKARRIASKNGFDETNIDEIYQYVPKSLQYLKKIEIDHEINICMQDKRMHEIFKYALDKEKIVVIASDMYLSKDTIETILKKNGYTGYNHLFLSSETRRNKLSGNTFHDIINYANNINPHEILHIGDNRASDYDSPNLLGIDSFLYESAKLLNIPEDEYAFFKHLTENINSLPISIAKSLFIIDTFNERDHWERFGYLYGGLVTYGFCNWLKENFDKENIKKAFFLSRDGFIPHKAFQIMFPDFETDYFYASRRCYLFSGLKDIKSILLYLVDQIGEGVTFDEYFESLLIESNEIKELYKQTFENKIINDDDKNKLKKFFIDNEEKFKEYAKFERNIALKYINQKGIAENSSALVDLGWSASIQNNIQNTLIHNSTKKKLKGFYIATYPIKYKIDVNSYLIKNGTPNELTDIISPLISIFELIFTAPHPGCVRLTLDKNKISPIFQNNSPEELIRIKASEKICKGILSFITDMKKVCNNLPITISPYDSLSPFKYFYKNLPSKFENILSGINFVTGIGDIKNYQKLFPLFNKHNSFGMVYTWPGSIRSAEYEFAKRLQVAARNIGYEVIFISKRGCVLDSWFRETQQIIDPEKLKFIITIHYDDFKMIDGFYYHALWYPIETFTQYSSSPNLMQNILSNDDFLIYDDGGMKNFIKSMLGNNILELDQASSLTPSFPASAIKKPIPLKIPILFYCGINWEKELKITSRHEAFFNMLDVMDNVRFFGPEINWKDYKNYCGQIPFDGFSILEEIRKCGVVLALSSKWHYRAGSVTNRIYEACAAGAVIITDDNTFVKKNFGDTVLYIDFDSNRPNLMVKQVKSHLEWIRKNPKEAMELASRSQAIFLKKFTLEKQIKTIINNHDKRQLAVAHAKHSKVKQTQTLIVSFIDSLIFNSECKNRIRNIIYNINHSIEKNIILVFACSKDLTESVHDFVNSQNKSLLINIQIISFNFYTKQGYKLITRCQAFFHIIKKIDHDYLMILNGTERIFTDHITILKRILEDKPNYIAAYSRRALDSNDGMLYAFQENPFNNEELYNCSFPDNSLNIPGMFLMRSNIENYLEKAMCGYIDGAEVPLLLNLAVFRHKHQLAFSEKLTISYREDLHYNYLKTTEYEYQINFIKTLVYSNYIEWKNSLSFQKNIHNTPILLHNSEEHFFNWIKKIYRMKLNIQIFLTRCRKLFCYNNNTRLHIKNKIKRLKNEKHLSN